MSEYKQAILESNTWLGGQERTIFVGYGLSKGRALGTLAGVPDEKIIECLVAENLMVGLSIGMSLTGKIPIVFIERMDFILNALDAIVNHLSAAKKLSRGEFTPAMIIRVVVGNIKKPLFTGHVHTQDFSDALEKMVDFPLIRLHDHKNIKDVYCAAYKRAQTGESTMLVEYKDYI